METDKKTIAVSEREPVVLKTLMTWRAIGVLVFLVCLAGGLYVGWCWVPTVVYEEIEQPTSFNHALHVSDDVGTTCEDCHPFNDDGSFAGIPTIESCAECHEELLGESEDEKKLFEEYISKEKEIPWLVYARQPQNVFFSHAPHVRLAEIECRQCHGDHGKSEELRPLARNRLSGYSRDIWGSRWMGGGPNPWDSMKMDDCYDCHKSRDVTDSCLTCHR